MKLTTERIFNSTLIALIFILSAVAIVIKIDSTYFRGDVSNWNYKQIEKIDRTKNDFSFVALADTHNSTGTFKKIIEKINIDNPDFIIVIGDLVADGGASAKKFRLFVKQIKAFNDPLLTAIGNHDIGKGGRAVYYNFFGPFYYSFQVGDSYFIVLDDATAAIDSWQFSWLKNELEKSRSFKNRFIFSHTPLFDPRDKGAYMGLKDRNFARQLNDLLDENKATMFFSGHIHGYYTGDWNKTPFIITGGAGGELPGSNPEHDFYNYIKVNVSGDNVNYDAVKIKSPDFDRLDRLIHTAWFFVYGFFVIHYLDFIIIIGLLYLAIYLFFIKHKWLVWNFRKPKSGQTPDKL